MTHDQAKEIFMDVADWCNPDALEVVEHEDRLMVWKSNRYGGRAYDDEVEIFNDGRVLFWQDGRPYDRS